MEIYPRVTVFTLIYNTNPRYIIEAIESVRANNYPNIQHIIIDDCSPDPIPKSIVKDWIAKENYPCEFYEHDVNFGICKTLNHVLQLAKGKYMFGCSDDVILCERIWGDINLFESNKLIDVVHSNYQIINSSGELSFKGKEISIENKLYFDRLLVSNFISAPTVTWKVERLKQVGGFSEKFKFEDYELWLRMAKMGCLFEFRNEITTLYRAVSYTHLRAHETN
jgi:glycosyltransferase involved in cell wall biosynthesis